MQNKTAIVVEAPIEDHAEKDGYEQIRVSSQMRSENVLANEGAPCSQAGVFTGHRYAVALRWRGMTIDCLKMTGIIGCIH